MENWLAVECQIDYETYPLWRSETTTALDECNWQTTRCGDL